MNIVWSLGIEEQKQLCATVVGIPSFIHDACCTASFKEFCGHDACDIKTEQSDYVGPQTKVKAPCRLATYVGQVIPIHGSEVNAVARGGYLKTVVKRCRSTQTDSRLKSS